MEGSAEFPVYEWMISWHRAAWPEGKRKRRKFADEKAARRLAKALSGSTRPDTTPVVDVRLLRRVVGGWEVVPRGGAR